MDTDTVELIKAVISAYPRIEASMEVALIHAARNADRIIQHCRDRSGYQAVRLKNLRKAVAQYRRGKDAFEFCELVEARDEARAEVAKLCLQRDVLALNWEQPKDGRVAVVYDVDTGGILGVAWPEETSGSQVPVKLPKHTD